jgi:hypothetical protein
MGKRLFALSIFVGAFASPTLARAADQWVSRPLTLPRLNAAFDAGLGVGHLNGIGNAPGLTGPGVNLEAALGVTSNLELGFRTGLRMTGDAQALHADQYGRLFDTETYGTGTDTLANPEFRITGRVLNAEVAEIGLEGRVYLPFEHAGNRPTHFGGAFGVPFLFHFGRIVRLDLGAYVVTIFEDPFRPIFTVPARLWFQVSEKVWLGPIFSLQHDPNAPVGAENNLLAGFGLGYQIASFVDLKTQFLVPAISQRNGTDLFGFGIGVQIRIE